MKAIFTLIIAIVFAGTLFSNPKTETTTVSMEFISMDTIRFGDPTFGLAQAMAKTAIHRPENLEIFLKQNNITAKVSNRQGKSNIVLDKDLQIQNITGAEILMPVLVSDLMVNFGTVTVSKRTPIITLASRQ